jgi:hypothetical protein
MCWDENKIKRRNFYASRNVWEDNEIKRRDLLVGKRINVFTETNVLGAR